MKNNRSLKKPVPERVEVDENAAKIFLFIEGDAREKDYFEELKKFSTQLKLTIFPPETQSAPQKLYEKAVEFVEKPQNDYDKDDGDAIWIVLDTDVEVSNQNPQGSASKKETLLSVRQKCLEQGWSVAQSNPCFEVWLYYHQNTSIPTSTNEFNVEVSQHWKENLNKIVKGGFNCTKHFRFIAEAIKNAEAIFERDENGMPKPTTTEVFLLAKKIYPFIQEKMEQFIIKLDKFNQDLKNNS